MRAVRLCSTIGQSPEEWRAVRRPHVGGSDLPAILGLSPFTTGAETAADKLGLLEKPQTAAMRRGHALEDAVARMWAENEGRSIRRVNAILQSREDPLFIANVDRLALGPEEVLEVKTAGLRGARFWGGDDPPVHVALQVHHYLRVLDLRVGHVAALVAGDPRSWVIYRDDDLIDSAWGQARAWWDRYVARGVLPEPTGSYADTEIIRRLYAAAEPGKRIDLPGDAATLLDEYAGYAAAEKAAAEGKAEAENRLKALLGAAEEGALGGRVIVTWKGFERKDLDTKRLRAEAPDMAERFTRTTIVRRFAVKEVGEGGYSSIV